MKGVVLAGGLGTRLRPLTSVMNKHLLPVYDRPMIYWPLQTLQQAGVEDAMVVVGGQSTEEIMKLLKDGREFGFRRLYYAYQEGEGGIAAALALTEEFVDEDNVCVILGDNVTTECLRKHVKWFDHGGAEEAGALLFLADVPDPENYGVVEVDGGGDYYYRISKPLIEKPQGPTNGLAVSGIYIYDRKVFSHIRSCCPSGRGELEITDVNNCYLRSGNLFAHRLSGFWGDAGSSIPSWLSVSKKVMEIELMRKGQME